MGVIFLRKQRRNRCIFPGYRWCGPNCSGPGAPTNEVDACCMRHDLCLQRGGNPCQCDYAFMDCLHTKMNPHTAMGKQAAFMYQAMRVRTAFKCRGFRS